MKTLGLMLVCAFCPVALAVPPAPVLTVHASGIRKLTFDWAPVAGASRYELWFKAADNAPWSRYFQAPAPRSSFTAGVAVHLLHWPQARYQLKACDSAGCSTSNTVRVNSEKTLAMGYFKPDPPTGVSFYGAQLALSADGTTMAVAVGEQVIGYCAVIYVYRRTNSNWQREARLVPDSAQGCSYWPFTGEHLELSGDGNLLVFGASNEDNSSDPNPADQAGAVYLFRRSGSTWRLAQKLVSPYGPGDNLGYQLKIDDAGRTLAITHRREGGEPATGALEIFRDDPDDGNDQFMHYTSVPVPRRDENGGICGAAVLSGDGNTLLRICAYLWTGIPFVQELETVGFTETRRFAPLGVGDIDVSYDGTLAIVNNNTNGQPVAYRLDSSGWIQDGILSTTSGGNVTSARDVAISRDGKIAAIGSPDDMAAGLGPLFGPFQTTDEWSGGVLIFERKTSGWVFRRLVKPGSANYQWAGYSLALGDNGRVLAAGAPVDPSAATGIDGNRHDDSAINRGAVWLY